MSDSMIPETIDPFACAKEHTVFHGVIKQQSMARLMDLLNDSSGDITVTIETGIDRTGLNYIKGHVVSVVELICQRCLMPFKKSIEADFSLNFVESMQDLSAVPEKMDALVIPQGDTINLWNMVEDECMVSLPMFAMHADDCLQQAQSGQDSVTFMQPSNHRKVFAELAEMLAVENVGVDFNGRSTKS
ncbi:MAG: DUF177 domain-containing protein [Legionellales bacterium]|nr:DUF177 domain-containing protein [Legionellales bacterium]